MRSFVFLPLLVAPIAAMMHNDDAVGAFHLFRLFLASEVNTETKVQLLSRMATSPSEEDMKDRVISCRIPPKEKIQILLGEKDRMVSGTFEVKLHNNAHMVEKIVYVQGESRRNNTLTIMGLGVSNQFRVSNWLISGAPEMELNTESEGILIEGIQTYVFPYNKAALSSFLSSSNSSSSSSSSSSGQQTQYSSNAIQNDVLWSSDMFRLFLVNELNTEIKVQLFSTQTNSHSKEDMKERVISFTIPASGRDGKEGTKIQILLGKTDRMVTASFGMKRLNVAYVRQHEVVHSYGDSGNSKTVRINVVGVYDGLRILKWKKSATEMELNTVLEGTVTHDGFLTYVFPYNKAALSSFLSPASSSLSRHSNQTDASSNSLLVSSKTTTNSFTQPSNTYSHSNSPISYPRESMPQFLPQHLGPQLSHMNNIQSQHKANAEIIHGPQNIGNHHFSPYRSRSHYFPPDHDMGFAEYIDHESDIFFNHLRTSNFDANSNPFAFHQLNHNPESNNINSSDQQMIPHSTTAQNNEQKKNKEDG